MKAIRDIVKKLNVIELRFTNLVLFLVKRKSAKEPSEVMSLLQIRKIIGEPEKVDC